MAELPGRLVFDEPAFRTIADPLGATNDQERAALLGVHVATYARLKQGDIEPGERVLKVFMAKFPTVDPRRVFRYDPDAKRPERAA